jgi:hypothetical protein
MKDGDAGPSVWVTVLKLVVIAAVLKWGIAGDNPLRLVAAWNGR